MITRQPLRERCSTDAQHAAGAAITGGDHDMTGTVALDVQHGTRLAAAVLAGMGAPSDIAEEVAAHLVEADCVGHGSHGISRLGPYLAHADSGVLVPAARPEVIAEGPGTRVNANWGLSHVGARIATDLACEQAKAGSIGMAGVVRSTHLGRLGAYMERACRFDCVAMAFVGGMGGSKLVAPFGGRAGLLGTNPIAAGFPTRSGAPLIVDFSTASTPIGKVMVAAMAGKRLPAQSLVDHEGRPTDDPHALDNGGAMRTFGEHKGFGLAVLIELLGKVLLGSEALSEGAGGPIFRAQGLVVITIAADAFRDLTDVLDDADQLRAAIRAGPAAAGFEQVLAPGDPEHAQRDRNSRTFEITGGAWDSIQEAAHRVGVPSDLVTGAMAH
jgi:LDH2 family malate/lactate/ureidoglycolate dehydrogenase